MIPATPSNAGTHPCPIQNDVGRMLAPLYFIHHFSWELIWIPLPFEMPHGRKVLLNMENRGAWCHGHLLKMRTLLVSLSERRCAYSTTALVLRPACKQDMQASTPTGDGGTSGMGASQASSGFRPDPRCTAQPRQRILICVHNGSPGRTKTLEHFPQTVACECPKWAS